MAGFVISSTTAGLKRGDEFALIGKLATPLKMYIQSESDKAASRGGPASWLCNQTPSDRFAETGVVEERSAGLFLTKDGDAAPVKDRHETDPSTIYMYQYMAQQIITKSLVEDSMGKVNGEIQRIANSLVRDYYTTLNLLASIMKANGTKSEIVMENGGRLPLPAPNNHPLYYKAHEVGDTTQSNIFYNTLGAGKKVDMSVIQELMGVATVKMSNMIGSDGMPLGYIPDTIIIPGNNPNLITACKQAIGSEKTDNGSGNASNGININVNGWNLIILPMWKLTDETRCPIIFESSDARTMLGGNMLYNRTPCEVWDTVDDDTRNYKFTARARLGIGHHTYKHSAMFELLSNGTTTLYDGQTAATSATQIIL